MTFVPYSQTAEHKLIEKIKDWIGSKYIGDDCAVLPGMALLTSDTLVEGTHFSLGHMSLSDLGFKAVAVNLSDIAGMAGLPRQLLVSLTVPEDFPQRSFRQLFTSMAECARAYRSTIVGGDITRGPLVVITIAALGEAHRLGVLKRSGALPGDVVAVTGKFGASAAGLWILKQGLGGFSHLRESHCRPKPALRESWDLIEHCGTRAALMDASDGLADALVQIARASKVGMKIELEKVPVHDETRQAAKLAGVNVLDWVLYGGEDYELVACIPEAVWELWKTSPENPFTAVGTVSSKLEMTLSYEGSSYPPIDLSRGFQHIYQAS